MEKDDFLAKMNGQLNQLQAKKIKAEARKATAQSKYWAMKARIFSGDYVPQNIYESELIKRVLVLRHDFEILAKTLALEIIQKTEGNLSKQEALTDFLLKGFKEIIDRYGEKSDLVAPVCQTPDFNEDDLD